MKTVKQFFWEVWGCQFLTDILQDRIENFFLFAI